MEFEDAFQVLDELVFAKTQARLKDVEKFVLQGAWRNQTYDAIADASEYRYTPSYLKQDVGPKLWKRLSDVLDAQVSKTNFRSALERLARSHDAQTVQLDGVARSRTDWGEAVDVSLFYGREAERSTLSNWILHDRARLIALLGMGGIGKTSLSVKLAQQMQPQFDCVIWRSLRNAQPIFDLLGDLIEFIADDAAIALADSVEGRISQVLTLLRQVKCFVVFDNVESILSSKGLAGQYRSNYESFGELLSRIAETLHQSCILLTSREKPHEVANFEGETLPVRSLQLSGLTQAEAQVVLQDKGLMGTVIQQQDLIDRYAGNPLALKIVATSIQEIFDGNIAEFLEQGTAVFNGIRKLLDRQLDRLLPIERSIMYWLAIEREPISLSELQANIVPTISKPKLLEALESLVRRSLIDRNLGKFTQQPVVMEYMIESLIAQICEELSSDRIASFNAYALMLAQTKDYIRETQIRLILMPIADYLLETFGTLQAVEKQLQQRLAKLRDLPLEPGYASGNIINLMQQLNLSFTNYDFSGLMIRQAYLPNVPLQNVNFADINLANCVFTEVINGISTIQFSPDGTQLATGDTDGNIQLWNAATGQQILVCQGHTRRVWSIAFNPDGQLLASASEDHTIRLWQVDSGQCIHCFEGHQDWAVSVAFHPTLPLIVSGSVDRTVKLWQIYTGDCVRTLKGHSDRIWSIAIHPNGRTIASASSDSTVRLWDVETGECNSILQAHTDVVYGVAFSSTDDLLATSSEDRTIRLWNSHGECVKILTGHTSWVTAIAFSSTERRLASSDGNGKVKLWDLDRDRSRDLGAHVGRAVIAFSPNGQILASASLDQTIKLWEVSTGQCFKTLQGYKHLVLSIAFAPDGSFATAHNDGAMQVWSADGQRLRSFGRHQSWVVSIAYSPDGQHLISGSSDYTAKIWQVETGECLKTLQGHTSRVWSVAVSLQGIIATGSPDFTIKLWSAVGECLKTLHGHDCEVWGIAFTPDGQLLASASNHDLRLWDVQTGDCRRILTGHTSWVWATAFHPNGHLLASSSHDKTIKFWDVKTGVCLRTLTEHTDWVWSIAFSPDGRTFASAADDLTIKLWDVETGECLQTLTGHTKRIWTIAFSPNGKSIASGGLDGTIKLWQVETSECVQTLTHHLYANTTIAGAIGLSAAQKQAFKQLGAKD